MVKSCFNFVYSLCYLVDLNLYKQFIILTFLCCCIFSMLSVGILDVLLYVLKFNLIQLFFQTTGGVAISLKIKLYLLTVY